MRLELKSTKGIACDWSAIIDGDDLVALTVADGNEKKLAEIVRRVNAHEGLVAALEDLVNGHSMSGEEAGRAALAAAKGGAT